MTDPKLNFLVIGSAAPDETNPIQQGAFDVYPKTTSRSGGWLLSEWSAASQKSTNSRPLDSL